MPPTQLALNGREALAMLFAGAVGLLLCVLLATKALICDDAPAGRRALVHSLPIVVAAISLALLGQFHMAVGIVFGASVAAMSTVVGFITISEPIERVPDRWRPLWTLAPVAAVLVLLIGMHGFVGWAAALLLAGQGAIILWLWLTTSAPSSPTPLAQQLNSFTWPGQAPPPLAEQPKRSSISVCNILVITGLALAISAMSAAASRASAQGAAALAHTDPRYTPGVIAATLLSIALALPMISSGMPGAMAGRGSEAISGQLGVAMINLCGVLPAIVGIWEGARRSKAIAKWLPGPREAGTQLLLPRGIWRIDAVVLVLLMLVLMGAAMGILRLDRRLGGILIFGYCAYVMHTIISGAFGVG